MKKTAISFEQLIKQLGLESKDLLQMGVNGSIKFYMALMSGEFIEQHEIDDHTGEWGLIYSDEELVQSMHVPVNENLCLSILKDGRAITTDFHDHNGRSAIRTKNRIEILGEYLFAYIEEAEKGGKKLRPTMHGNKKHAYYRNQKIYEVAEELIENNPLSFCTASSKRKKYLKISAVKLGTYLLSNQQKLFGKEDFIEVEHETLVDKILNKEGFGTGVLSRAIRKPE